MNWPEAQAFAFATGVAIRRAAWRRWIWAPMSPASLAPIWMCRYVDRGPGNTAWIVRDLLVQARPAGYPATSDGPFFEAVDFQAEDWTAAVWENYESYGMERPGAPWQSDPEPGGGDQPGEDPAGQSGAIEEINGFIAWPEEMAYVLVESASYRSSLREMVSAWGVQDGASVGLEINGDPVTLPVDLEVGDRLTMVLSVGSLTEGLSFTLRTVRAQP